MSAQTQPPAETPFDESLSWLIHTPPEAATAAREAIADIRKFEAQSLRTGIATFDDYFAPVLPGEVCTVIAQTSNGKSSWLDFIENSIACQLQARDSSDVIVKVSVEETLEKIMYRKFGRALGKPMGEILRTGQISDQEEFDFAVTLTGAVPVYYVARSLKNARLRRKEAPLHMSNIFKCLEFIQDRLLGQHVNIAALTLDYLQKLPYDPVVRRAPIEQQRRTQVREDMARLFDIAAQFGTQVWNAVQACDPLKGALSSKMHLPGVYDGQETTSIGQDSDRTLSLWMPKQTNQIGSIVRDKGIEFEVREDLVWARVCKQRGGFPAGRCFPLKINYVTNEFSFYEGLVRKV